ncbi:LytR/AlgR family response regulator transcription factor [Paraflavitalea speifideaquila]|uniref:LytR/AlgR family response regulator transcription factor n=1 Tax=Paraflavitalea speifideaquila TaxID=3076558 RepID=UPI0028EF1AF8|nr:LytTR family transcriptional regulator DNA-binding domain-containing protein [Paraflavitalea speifideiaquila]
MQQEISTINSLPTTSVKGRNEKQSEESSTDHELMNLFNLLKAREPELLKKLLNSCVALLLKDDEPVQGLHLARERFLVKTGRHLISVHISQVAFFYCENKTVYLKTKDDRNHILKASIEEIEHTVSPRDFFRISRQMIVSRHAIKKRSLSGSMALCGLISHPATKPISLSANLELPCSDNGWASKRNIISWLTREHPGGRSLVIGS